MNALLCPLVYIGMQCCQKTMVLRSECRCKQASARQFEAQLRSSKRCSRTDLAQWSSLFRCGIHGSPEYFVSFWYFKLPGISWLSGFRWRTHRSPEYFVNFRRFKLPVTLDMAKRRFYKALPRYQQTQKLLEELQELCIDVYQRHHARKLEKWSVLYIQLLFLVLLLLQELCLCVIQSHHACNLETWSAYPHCRLRTKQQHACHVLIMGLVTPSILTRQQEEHQLPQSLQPASADIVIVHCPFPGFYYSLWRLHLPDYLMQHPMCHSSWRDTRAPPTVGCLNPVKSSHCN